jgi:hypothetical protein
MLQARRLSHMLLKISLTREFMMPMGLDKTPVDLPQHLVQVHGIALLEAAFVLLATLLLHLGYSLLGANLAGPGMMRSQEQKSF